MAKIYNEVIIDMNPESPTFEETLYEDSFEYSGDDMILAQGFFDTDHYFGNDEQGYLKYTYGEQGWTTDFSNRVPADQLPHGASTFPNMKAFREAMEGQRDLGSPIMTEETWSQKDAGEQAQYILDTKYGAHGAESVTLADGTVMTKEDLMKDLEIQPLKGDIDQTQAGFLEEQYGGSVQDRYDINNDGMIDVRDAQLAPANLKQTIIDIWQSQGMGASEVTGTSFSESLAGRAAGATYDAAGRSLTGDIYALQGKASEFSPAASTGVGMRSKIAGREKIKKGHELAYETYGAAGEAYGLAETTAGLEFQKGIYGLEQDVIGDWESAWKTFWDTLPDAT